MALNSKQYVLDALSTQESWRLFKIMAEIVNGFEALSTIDKNCISMFGSARTKPDEPIYQEAQEMAHKLAEAGYGIITGGGPGLMEAANKGASEVHGTSVGLHIHLPMEQNPNPYLGTRCDFDYFFVRKLMFVKYSMAYIVLPGGGGTLDELFEAFVLMQTKRAHRFPIVLYKKDYWSGLIDWMRAQMVAGGYMREEELELITILDTPEEVISYMKKYVAV